MHIVIKKSLSVISALLLSTGCSLSIDTGTSKIRELVTDAEVSLAKAIDAAALTVPGGAVIEAGLEVEATTPVYEVRMFADGSLTKVHVDPDTGAVVRSEIDTDDEDVAEAQLAAGLLQGATLDAAAAIAVAEQFRPGSTAFEVEVEDGLLEVEVVDAGGLFEIYIDPADGSVIASEISDDHGGVEQDDDDGKDTVEPGDDDGQDTTEPGDDDGNGTDEPGDDNGEDDA